jgi:hypothetical protein
MSDEWWQPCTRHNAYEVSSMGRVRNVATDHVLKGWGACKRKPYLHVELGGVRHPVHQMVCEAFHGKRPMGHVAAHINGDPKDNRAANLVWVTERVNMHDHRVAQGRFTNLAYKLSDEDMPDIIARRASGQTLREIGEHYGVSLVAIHLRLKRARASQSETNRGLS